MGLLFCLLGALAFGAQGSVSKLAEQRRCVASGLVVSMCGWAAVAMLGRSLTLPSGFNVPLRVVPVAVACGFCSAVAYFAFQTSIQVGKVTVAWLMMGLSAGVPAVVSIWVYNEKLTATKIIAFALGLAAVLCLFQGQRIDAREAVSANAKKD